MTERFDLIVVGGGPAGATLATLVAKHGHRVLLLERDTFPRHQVGESLLPATINGICDLLGVRDEIKKADFPKKLGGTFRWGTDEKLWTLNFGHCSTVGDPDDNHRVHAYQVRRSDFDDLLLRNAAHTGVEVRHCNEVHDVLVSEEGRISGVHATDAQGRKYTVTARFVADASGHGSRIASKIGERINSQFYRHVGVYAYFENGGRLPGAEAGNTLFEAFDGGWLWYIPLSATLTSVGAVLTRAGAARLQGDHKAALSRIIEDCPLAREFLKEANQSTEPPYDQIRIRKDFSYCHSRFWMPGAVLLGDAACFVDVLLSSGVHLATYSALLAARSINTCLSTTAPENVCFEEYELRYRTEFSRFYQLLVGLYDMRKDAQTYHSWLRNWIRTTNAFRLEPVELDRLFSPNAGSQRDISSQLNALRDFNRRVLETDREDRTMEQVEPVPVYQYGLRPSADSLTWEWNEQLQSNAGSSTKGSEIQEISGPLYDYGKLYAGVDPYRAIAPANAVDAQQVVRRALKENLALRVRASGHTFSGASLPQEGELLIRTDRLDEFRFEQPGTVTVGAGALVWDVRDLLADYSLELPVYNGGWAGPTVGGYLSAGGFGKSGRSEEFGGFWENVEEITLIDGRGEFVRITRQDPRFPWLFGSYGQLGLVTELKLKVLSNGTPYPLGHSGHIPKRQQEDPKINDLAPRSGGESHLFWFSILVSPENESRAWEDLHGFVKRHFGFVIPQGGWSGPSLFGQPIGYRYTIPFLRFHPPLIYSRPESFLVLGVMSMIRTGEPALNARVLAVEKDFVETALNGNHGLYLQAENIGRSIDFRGYYGSETFDSFARLKREFDPQNIFNRGVFFQESQS